MNWIVFLGVMILGLYYGCHKMAKRILAHEAILERLAKNDLYISTILERNEAEKNDRNNKL